MYDNVLHYKRSLFLFTIFEYYVQSYQEDF